MKKSELKQLIREVISEYNGTGGPASNEAVSRKKPSTKYKTAMAAQDKASGIFNKPGVYKLVPHKDPTFPGEVEMFIKNEPIAVIHRDDKTGNFIVFIYRSSLVKDEDEYETSATSFEDAADYIYVDIIGERP